MGRTWTMPRRGKYALALGVAALTATAAIAGAGSAGAADSAAAVTARARPSRPSRLAADRDPAGSKDGATDACADRSEPAGQRGATASVSVVVKLNTPGRVVSRHPEGPARDQPAGHRPRLNRRSAAVRAYGRYIARRDVVQSALAARVP